MNTTTPIQQQWQQQQKTTSNNSSISKDNKKTATTKQQQQQQEQRQWQKNSRDNTKNTIIQHNKCQIEQNNDVLIKTMLQKSHKNRNSNDSDESRNINNRYQNRFCKSSPYYNPYIFSSKNKSKCYFRHSVQRSVPMAPLSSEYFSSNFFSVKGLMGRFCQSM